MQGNERGFGVEMMAIRAIPSSSKETYCTSELLKCGALLLSVRCTERNVTTIDGIGILLFYYKDQKTEEKKSSAADCNSQRQTCHHDVRITAQNHIIVDISFCLSLDLLVNSKQ